MGIVIGPIGGDDDALTVSEGTTTTRVTYDTTHTRMRTSITWSALYTDHGIDTATDSFIGFIESGMETLTDGLSLQSGLGQTGLLSFCSCQNVS